MNRAIRSLGNAQIELLQFVWATFWLCVFLWLWRIVGVEDYALALSATVTLVASFLGGLWLEIKRVERDRREAADRAHRVARVRFW